MDLFEPEAQQQPIIQRSEHDAEALSDIALHRETRTAVAAAERAVFTNLAGLIRRVIQRQLWERYGFRDFAAYALTSGNGLNVNTNGRLYMLKLSMDIQGRHRQQWLEILLQVEAFVRLQARKQGVALSSLRGNSLRTLACRNDYSDAPICYLPSGQSGGGAADGNLVRLRKRKPELLKRVLAGELSLPEARREAGYAKPWSALGAIKRLLPRLTDAEREELQGLLSNAPKSQEAA